MDEEQKRKLLQQIYKQMEENMPAIEGMANVSGLASVGKPVATGAIRKVVDMMEPKVSESGLISPAAEKFSAIRRYLQELGGTGAQSPKSVEAQRMVKAKNTAKDAMDAQELKEFSLRNKPSDAETALNRYRMDREADELGLKRRNLEETFDLSKDRRK